VEEPLTWSLLQMFRLQTVVYGLWCLDDAFVQFTGGARKLQLERCISIVFSAYLVIRLSLVAQL
jgi:hypothetical protein